MTTIALASLLSFLLSPLPMPPADAAGVPRLPAPQASEHRSEFKKSEYTINASLIIIGNLGEVGSMAIEDHVLREEGYLQRVLRMYGQTKPEMAEKGRDFSGEFKITKRLPLREDGSIDQEAVDEWRGYESFYSGLLKRNEDTDTEEVVFHPDHAVSTREDGEVNRIEGVFSSPLSPLEKLLDTDIEVGDVFESKFILSGYPYIFEVEVDEKEMLKPFNVPTFKVCATTYDGIKKDRRGRPKLIRKKGIRAWICKEGAYKDRILRLDIKYKWYLTMKCHYKSGETILGR